MTAREGTARNPEPLTLVELRAAYVADRAAMDARHPPLAPASNPRREHCRYCGGAWQRWTGGHFDGHVKCVVSRPFQKLIADILSGGNLTGRSMTYVEVATALDVSYATVRAWWNNSKGNPFP